MFEYLFSVVACPVFILNSMFIFGLLHLKGAVGSPPFAVIIDRANQSQLKIDCRPKKEVGIINVESIARWVYKL
jgi:hypothetical protein